MKKLIILALVLLAALMSDAEVKRVGTPSTTIEQTADGGKGTKTGWVVIDKDGQHTVYRGPKGGLFYVKNAKSGKNAGKPVRRSLSKDDRQTINQK